MYGCGQEVTDSSAICRAEAGREKSGAGVRGAYEYRGLGARGTWNLRGQRWSRVALQTEAEDLGQLRQLSRRCQVQPYPEGQRGERQPSLV